MSKGSYTVRIGTKEEFSHLLDKYHYLQKVEKRKYRVGFNVVLVHNLNVVGVAIFTNFPVPEVVVGAFGLERTDQEGMYELSRFCINPAHQKTEHNLATWFLAKAIKMLRKAKKVRAILSYADSKYHSGVIYRAYGFKYYGLTAKKKDFKKYNSDIPNSRGCQGAGEWVDRSQKHRYLLVYDKSLTVRWEERKWEGEDLRT
jgi:hypothetical protein